MTLLGLRWSDIASSAAAQVDRFEVNGWTLDGPLPAGPYLLHNLDLDFSLTRPGVIDDRWLARCEQAILRTGSPWFSLHLGFSAERVRFADGMLPLSPTLDRDTCLTRLIETIARVKRSLSVPLLIENLDYCPGGAYEHICRPDFIAEVLERTDCGLLLDLAHLQVSADWQGLSPEEYLARLPLERVVEVHVSSPRRVGERLDDQHEELLERDYELLRLVLERSQPRAVVLEYSRAAERLSDQLRRVRLALDGMPSAMGNSTVEAPAQRLRG